MRSTMRRSNSGRKWRINPWDGPCRRISQRADRVAFDLVRDFFEKIDLRDLRPAFDQAVHHPGHPAGAFSAGRALSTTFMHVELGQSSDRLDDIRRLVHDDDRRGSQARLDVLQRVEIHQHRVTDRLGNHRHRRAAGNHGEQVVPSPTHAAGMLLDQLTHGDAHLFFDVAGFVDVPRNAEDLGSRIVGTPESREPRGSPPKNLWRDGNRLDVVDGRGATPYADRRREGRLKPRLSFLALKALDEGHLLAADVSAGAGVDVDVEVVT